MKRRKFLTASVSTPTALATVPLAAAPARPVSGVPAAHLPAVRAHSDDIPHYVGGLVAQLVEEGNTAYLIRISNDEAAGVTLSAGVAQNEADNQELARPLGWRKEVAL
jgi:hypothetical protein